MVDRNLLPKPNDVVPNEARVTNVFVAGPRRVSHLGADVRRRLDEMIQRELSIVVGDANGADKAIQTHFAERSLVCAFGALSVVCVRA